MEQNGEEYQVAIDRLKPAVGLDQEETTPSTPPTVVTATMTDTPGIIGEPHSYNGQQTKNLPTVNPPIASAQAAMEASPATSGTATLNTHSSAGRNKSADTDQML